MRTEDAGTGGGSSPWAAMAAGVQRRVQAASLFVLLTRYGAALRLTPNLIVRCHRSAEGCDSVNAKVERRLQGTQAARSKMGAQNACLSNCAKPWRLSCVPPAAAPFFAAELCLGSPSLQAPTFAVLGRSGLRRVAQHQLGRPACRRSRAPSALGSSSRTGYCLAASL